MFRVMNEIDVKLGLKNVLQKIEDACKRRSQVCIILLIIFVLTNLIIGIAMRKSEISGCE